MGLGSDATEVESEVALQRVVIATRATVPGRHRTEAGVGDLFFAGFFLHEFAVDVAGQATDIRNDLLAAPHVTRPRRLPDPMGGFGEQVGHQGVDFRVLILHVLGEIDRRHHPRIDHVPLIEERGHAGGGAEVVRLGDPADGPLRRGLLRDAIEVRARFAQIGETPVVDLVTGVAAVQLDGRRGFGDGLPAIDRHLAGMALDASRFVVLPRIHRCLVVRILFPAPVTFLHVARRGKEAQSQQ